MCRLYGKFASYLRRVLCKTRLIFINGPNVATIRNNVTKILQRCVALKIVVANRLVQHHLTMQVQSFWFESSRVTSPLLFFLHFLATTARPRHENA